MRLINIILFLVWILALPYAASLYFELDYLSTLAIWIPFCFVGLLWGLIDTGY